MYIKGTCVKLTVLIIAVLLVLPTTGCVERQLTINTKPQGALVTLNDEQIGNSPVTVAFSWYGDYRVNLQKQGYETLKTHKAMDRPLHDKFPFDFFAQLWPAKIEDHYEWEFELTEYKAPDRENLIDQAIKMQAEAGAPLDTDSENAE